MTKVVLEDESLYDIGDAIREGNGSSATYKPGQMAAAIRALGGITVVPLSVSQNGTYNAPTGQAYNPVEVSVSGGGNLYTNAYTPGAQITDVSAFTKLYSTSIQFGNYGAKVENALGLTDESTIETNMSTGWNSSNAAFYDVENISGAYAGYGFSSAKRLSQIKLYLNRYSNQNKSLSVDVEYQDANGVWQNIETLDISTTIPYPVNIFTVNVPNLDIYGIRWIHTTPIKTSGNNVSFFGMTLYAQGSTAVYIPSTKGLIEPPTGYDGFGPLYIP